MHGAARPACAAEFSKKRVCLLLCVLAAVSLILQPERDFLGYGWENDLMVRILEHQPDGVDRPFAVLCDVHAIDANGAGIGFEKPADQSGKSGFSGSIETDQTDAAFGQRQRNIVNDRTALKTERCLTDLCPKGSSVGLLDHPCNLSAAGRLRIRARAWRSFHFEFDECEWGFVGVDHIVFDARAAKIGFAHGQ